MAFLFDSDKELEMSSIGCGVVVVEVYKAALARSSTVSEVQKNVCPTPYISWGEQDENI